MYTAGHRIWQENRKTWKIRNAHFMFWNKMRNTEKFSNGEIHTVGPGIWAEI